MQHINIISLTVGPSKAKVVILKQHDNEPWTSSSCHVRPFLRNNQVNTNISIRKYICLTRFQSTTCVGEIITHKNG